MAIEYTDLRGWLKKAEDIGQLKVLKNVELEEVGTITQVNSRNRGPALLFDSIPGYGEGYRILTNSLNNSSLLALTFELDPNLNTKQIINWSKGKFTRWVEESKKYEPTYVDDGPILENVESGADVDLTKFPVPKWHSDDCGPYIGTGVAVITKDPETRWVNLGTYRSQLYGKNLVGSNIELGKHGYFKAGKRCLSPWYMA